MRLTRAGLRYDPTSVPPSCFGWPIFSINTVPEAAQLAALDNGTPIGVMNPGAYAAEWVRYYAEWCDKLHDEDLPTSRGLGHIRREPYGVVVAIPPWNGSMMGMGQKCGPALAAGNQRSPSPPNSHHSACCASPNGPGGGAALRRPQCRGGRFDRRISTGRTHRSGQNQLHRWDKDGTTLMELVAR